VKETWKGIVECARHGLEQRVCRGLSRLPGLLSRRSRIDGKARAARSRGHFPRFGTTAHTAGVTTTNGCAEKPVRPRNSTGIDAARDVQSRGMRRREHNNWKGVRHERAEPHAGGASELATHAERVVLLFARACGAGRLHTRRLSHRVGRLLHAAQLVCGTCWLVDCSGGRHSPPPPPPAVTAMCALPPISCSGSLPSDPGMVIEAARPRCEQTLEEGILRCMQIGPAALSDARASRRCKS
jgi:hypothetical protein